MPEDSQQWLAIWYWSADELLGLVLETMMFISDIIFYLNPAAVAAGAKVSLINGQYIVTKAPATTIQAVNGGSPPADQAAEVAALTAQVAQLTTDLAACQAGNPSPLQTIDSFTAVPNPIVAGQPVTLTWTTTGASVVTLNGAAVALSGSQVVNPGANTTYTLSASSAPVTQAINVVVTAGQAKPTITNMTATPSSLPVGGGQVVINATVGGQVDTLKIQIDSGPLTDVVLPATITL